jgi:hypothetical protein
VHFGITRRIISDKDTGFISTFWTTLWEKMNNKLNISTTFHPQTNVNIEVVNRTLVKLLRGYNQKHPNTWDENMICIQHSYNRAVHTSTSKSSFKNSMDIFHLHPWMC